VLLSRNYPPAPELAPYVRRHYIFNAELPLDYTLVDKLVSETGFIRVLLRGDWYAETAPDNWTTAGPVPLFGSNGKPLRVKVTGPFTVTGFAIRPSGWRALFGCSACDYADRMVPLADAWGRRDADDLHQAVLSGGDDAAIVAGVESILLRRIAASEFPPDQQMRQFEDIARNDSTIRVHDAADALGLSVRQMERQCRAAFGHSPKAVLRRSRFLDMAMAMRGFSDFSAEDLAALRYFDQSHLNREFRRFFGVTPGVFQAAQTPLFTAGLKLRADGLT
jgi:AraC-like DNA-binding protein